MDMIRKEVNRTAFAILEELRVGPDDLCVGTNAARYVHEMIIPFVRAPGALATAKATSSRPPQFLSKKFSDGVQLPGSPWIYAKLYGSPRQVQSMLRDEMPNLIRRLREECGVRDAFFFRYDDTDWHVRLRAHVPAKAKRTRAFELINTAAADLQTKEIVWRFQYDTYYREIERFGGAAACRLVERFFSVESRLALTTFEMRPDDVTHLRQIQRLAAGWTLRSWTRLGLTPETMFELSR